MATLAQSLSMSPDKLMQIFYKYPLLEYLPITSEQNIKAFLSKEMTFRQANTKEFFDKDLIQSIPHIMVKMNEDLFFEELDKQIDDLVEIPIVDAKNFTLKFLSRNEFYAVYRPVEELPAGDFKTLLDEMTMPVLIFNSHHRLIYKNKKSRKLLRAFQESLASKSTKFEDYLPGAFFHLLDEPDSKRTYHLDAGTGVKPFDYRLSMIELPRGPVSMVAFLPNQDDRW
jgi:hypothetical protein